MGLEYVVDLLVACQRSVGRPFFPDETYGALRRRWILTMLANLSVIVIIVPAKVRDGCPGRDPPDGAGLLFPKTPPVANHPDVARLWYLKAGMEQIIGLSMICRRGR